MITNKTLSVYRKQLKELQDDLADAEELGDIDRCEKIKQDREDLLKEINSATNKHGSPRAFPTAQEKARQAVSKAITRARNSFKDSSPRLYEHLMTYLSIGNVCVYSPPVKMKWS